MTIDGALNDLNNLLKADDIPIYYKPSIKAVMETITMEIKPMPKMGAWEWLSYEGIDEGNWHCSECRMIIPRMPIDDDGKPLYKCCPFCGSKNRGDAE